MEGKVKKCMLQVLTLLAVSHSCLTAAAAAAALDFGQENCILSFVVPRDKVKSSCDMEERVSRRLNAMETKVTLYKQHVMELQQQLQKERDSHSQRVEELQARLARTVSQEDEMLQRRIQALEEAVRKLGTTSSSSPSLSNSLDEKSTGGHGRVPSGRTKEEEKILMNLVKTVVHSEVKKLFDNYTQYVGRYVRDQALAFNQIINMVPRSDQSLPPPDASKWIHSSKPDAVGEEAFTATTLLPTDKDHVLLEELEGIRKSINSTGKQLADHVEKVFKNVTGVTLDSTSPSPQASRVTVSLGTATGVTEDADSSLLDVNDTSSGDANDKSSEQNITLSFTEVGDGGIGSEDDVSSSDVKVSAGDVGTSDSTKDASDTVQSRMSHNTKVESGADGIPSTKDKKEVGEGGNQSAWEQNMVHDQSQARWVQMMLRQEIQSILQQQAEEVLSLVSKHTARVDSRLQEQERRVTQIEQRLAADIKHLDQLVGSLKLELTSVSQGVQTLYQRTDKAEELQDTVIELKKNMSMEGNNRLMATLLDEQGKKVRKLERLTEIYKQSLEHYRNETKLEYRDLKERLSKESSVVKSLNQALYANISSEVKQANLALNTTLKKQVDDVRQRVQVMEDNSLLLQIDLSSFERQLKAKSSKSERDIDSLKEDVRDLKQKARNLQKTLSSTESGQEHLFQVVNSTTKEVQSLQTEVKLNVLGDWLPYNFEYRKTRTDCFGEQFIRKSSYKKGRLVGVVLCTNKRYKIFLGQSLTDVFLNIGDDTGLGEDHCEFVNAPERAQHKVSPFRTSTSNESGYVRSHWGEEPKRERLNIIRPSPMWYECGVSIP